VLGESGLNIATGVSSHDRAPTASAAATGDTVPTLRPPLGDPVPTFGAPGARGRRG
jgi:hypothetical protein